MSELPPEALAPDPGPPPDVPAAADTVLPPPDRDLGLAWRWIGAVVVVACCLVVFWQLNPTLLLRDTTANGGDMGAHVWFPAYLKDHLLALWRVAGWSPDWFAGFPAGQFYFPIPALLMVLLDFVMPYNVAFKLVTALGLVLMPLGAYGLGRGLNVRRPGPELFAVLTTLFLFFKGVTAAPGTHDATIQFNQRIMGGPIVSALAGEYSFSLALAFALAFLGALAYSLRTRRRLWLPAVLLAGAVLSHIVVGIFFVIAALVVWLFHRPLRTFRIAGAVGIVGALLTAFWSVPLLATFAYTANMRYEKLTWYLDYLFPARALVGRRARGDRGRGRAGAPGPCGAHAHHVDRRRSPSCSGCGPSCTRGTCASCRSGTSDCSCWPVWASPRSSVRSHSGSASSGSARLRSRATSGSSIPWWTGAGSGW